MLCDACTNIFSAVKTHPPGEWIGIEPKLFAYPRNPNVWLGSHHIEPHSFLNAAQGRCYICSTIYRDCSTKLRTQANSLRTFYELTLATSGGPHEAVKARYDLDFTIEILDGQEPIAKQQVIDCNGTFKILPKQEVSAPGEWLTLTPNTFTGQCEDQVRHWLENCAQNHIDCNQDWRVAGKSPARLLNVCPDLENSFRLEAFPGSVRPPKYVTLSHCWGTEMTATLTTLNQAELINRYHSTTSLPQRFQDAMEIAKWMRVQYIWIDALCIIQDSAEDWLSESAKMGDIYTSSYCNIAATSAGPQKGCFTNRLVSMVEPYAIPNPQLHEESATYVVGYDDFWSNSLLDTPLHARGWVLQERLLSPRTIHFGQEQIFWECRCQMACEAYPTGIPEQFKNRRTRAWRQADQMLDPHRERTSQWSLMGFLSRFSLTKPKHNPAQLSQIYGIWSNIVEAYMECKLSYDDDKLVAISGIAQKVAGVTGERYLAGLWENSLLGPGLLWYVLGRRQADGTSSIGFAPEGHRGYRAPSWSWASLEARVIWNWPVSCEEVLIDIIKTDIREPEGSKLGRVSSARMHVRGSLFEAKLSIVTQSRDESFVEDGRYALCLERTERHQANGDQLAEQTMEPIVYLDMPLMSDRSSRRTSIEVFLLPVCLGWQGRSANLTTRLAGLLLTRPAFGSSRAVFTRIGVFGMDHNQTRNLYGPSSDEAGFIKKRTKGSDNKAIVLV
ncbi:hypothetical protein H2200_000151 [Cladophialophora chaetospira]|uniref:Heterokaryon incompatibility domain-containing protein n=1 Tax=Cladophialophora chaetospira TaxID=386627 RepID=A0AA39CQN6_9EURO|nr:hypothetical protein H2200_000151 [Cladophialophora chaetospira]